MSEERKSQVLLKMDIQNVELMLKYCPQHLRREQQEGNTNINE